MQKHCFTSAGMLAALLAIGIGHVQAATIVRGGASPLTAYISQKEPVASFNFSFDFSYYNNEKIACGAAINFGDGQPLQMVTIPGGMPKMELMHKYTALGSYSVSMSGMAHSGMPACLGSQSASVNVLPTIQVAQPDKLSAVQLAPGPYAPTTAFNLPVKLLATNAMPNCGYSAHVYSMVNGNSFEVTNDNGTTALPADALQLHLGAMNQTGHYRLDVTGTKNCKGTVSAEFDVQRSKLELGAAAASLTGVKANFYGAGLTTTKSLTIALAGNSPQGLACPLHIDVRADETGATFSETIATTLPHTRDYVLTAAAFKSQTLPFGHYTVTARPLLPNELASMDGSPKVCAGGAQTAGFENPRQALGDLGMPALDSAFLTVNTNGSPGSGSGSSAGPIVYADKTSTGDVTLGVKITHPEAAKNGCGYTIDISNGAKTAQAAANSTTPFNIRALIDQQMGWSHTNYLIKLHPSALNTNQPTPPCLGQKELTLSVGEKGGTIMGLTVTSSFQDTWDSATLVPQFFVPFYALTNNHLGNVYAQVTLKPRIAGNPCVYSISLQAPGDAPTFTSTMMHIKEGADSFTFEAYRGANGAEAMKNLHDYYSRIRYSLVIRTSPKDVGNGSAVACNGEYRNDNFYLPL